jgi:hypothetical protein
MVDFSLGRRSEHVTEYAVFTPPLHRRLRYPIAAGAAGG